MIRQGAVPAGDKVPQAKSPPALPLPVVRRTL